MVLYFFRGSLYFSYHRRCNGQANPQLGEYRSPGSTRRQALGVQIPGQAQGHQDECTGDPHAHGTEVVPFERGVPLEGFQCLAPKISWRVLSAVERRVLLDTGIRTGAAFAG